MNKNLKKIIIIILMIITITACGKKAKEKTKMTDEIKKLYEMIEVNYIPEVYEGYSSYSNYNFYIDKEIKYDDLTDEARLYYAYNIIENNERKWFNSCYELKGYEFKNEDISITCKKSNGEMIAKGQSSDEWFFYTANKSDIEKAYKNMYGEDKKIQLKSFTMNVTGMCVYSQTKEDFLCFETLGGGGNGYAETKFNYYIENKDTIEIYDSYIWIEEGPEGQIYYKSRFDKKETLKSKDFSEGAKYKHTFKKDKNNNYYWYSSERID